MTQKSAAAQQRMHIQYLMSPCSIRVSSIFSTNVGQALCYYLRLFLIKEIPEFPLSWIVQVVFWWRRYSRRYSKHNIHNKKTAKLVWHTPTTWSVTQLWAPAATLTNQIRWNCGKIWERPFDLWASALRNLCSHLGHNGDAYCSFYRMYILRS